MTTLGEVRGRRQLPWQPAVVLLALIGAACSAPKVAGPATTPAPPPAVVTAPQPAAPLPTVAQNKVALLVPLTGSNAAVGQSIANAATMAMLDAGSNRVNLRVYDTAGGASGAAAKAVAEGAKVFLGPLLGPDVRAVQAVASANNLPVIAFTNDAALAGSGTFVMGFQPGQSIGRVVAYARSRGVERFAALVPSGVYGQRASTAFLRAVDAAGGTAVAVTTYTRTSEGLLAAARKVTNFDARKAATAKTAAVRADGTVATVAPKLAPVGFQALLIADSGAVAAAVAPALTQFGATPVVLMGTELWNTEPSLKNTAALRGAVFATVPDDRFTQLAARYRAKFGASPSRLASLGYDAALLVNGIAATWALGAPFPRDKLTSPAGFAGVDGVFRFGASGVAERGLAVEQIGPDGFAIVSPAPRSF